MLLVGTTGERSQIGVPGKARNAVDTSAAQAMVVAPAAQATAAADAVACSLENPETCEACQ